MNLSEFKSQFGEIARSHGFISAYGGWHRQTPVALFVLELQKSNFGNYFELNLKLFLEQKLPVSPVVLKKFVKNLSGDIFRRQPEEYRHVFDLDSDLADSDRRALVERIFVDLVEPITAASADPAGLIRLRDRGLIYLLPAAEAKLRSGLKNLM